MFAYLFGIADKVAKQFKNMYPEYIESLDNNLDLDTLIFFNTISIPEGKSICIKASIVCDVGLTISINLL